MIENVSLVSLDSRRMERSVSQPRSQLFCTCVCELLEVHQHNFSFSSNVETQLFQQMKWHNGHIFKLNFYWTV